MAMAWGLSVPSLVMSSTGRVCVMDLSEHIRLAGIIRGLADKLSGEDYARIWDEVMALDVADDEGDDSLSLDDGLPTISDSSSLEVARTKLTKRLETAMMDASTRSLFLRSLDSALDVTLDNDGCRILSKRLGAVWRLLDLPCPVFRLEDVEKARVAMDESHEGLGRLKDFLLDELALAALDGTTPHPVLLVGPPGCGKTSLSVSLASALDGHGHSIITMAGKSAAFELGGNDQGWSRAGYGSIASAFIQASSLSPIIIFDELDKVGSENRYSRADSVFLDLLQPERSAAFTDAFLMLPFDASHAWYIFTANKLEGIPEPLLDRLTVFEMDRYSFGELVAVAQRLVDRRNVKVKCKLKFAPGSLERLVLLSGGQDSSVRPMARAVDRIWSAKAREIVHRPRLRSLVVGNGDVEAVLGGRTRTAPIPEGLSLQAGIVNAIGLADGLGVMLPVEVRNAPCPLLDVRILGDVADDVKEAVMVAVELVDSYADKELFTHLGRVGVNFVRGISMSGESLALAVALALLSELLGKAVPPQLAVMGGLSMKGCVLPVDGLLARLVGASRQGAREIVLPEANRRDVDALPPALLPDVRLTYVSSFEEAVGHVLPPVRPASPPVKSLERGA